MTNNASESVEDPGIAPTYHLSFDNILPLEGGHKYWPELYVAMPSGYRTLTMSLAVPKGDGPHPLVIFIHGGGWQSGHHNVQNPVLDRMMITQSLLDAGYAVARSSYRFTDEGKFPMQLHDSKAAVRYLRHHAARFGLDETRFAAMGESAGGHLALLLGLVQGDDELEGDVGIIGPSSEVCCVVNWYGVVEFATLSEQNLPESERDHEAETSPVPRLLGGDVQTNMDAAKRASPMTYVTADAVPILSQHGRLDMIVPFGQAEALHEKMTSVGAHHELHAIEGADHCFWHGDEMQVMPRVIEFLNAHCHPKSGAA